MPPASSYIRGTVNGTLSKGRGQADWLVDNSAVATFTYIIADAIAIVSSAFLSAYLSWESWQLDYPQRVAVVLATLLTWIVFNTGGLYSSWRGRAYIDHIRAACAAWFTVVVLLVVLAYLIEPSVFSDRGWVITWALLGLLAVAGVRVSAMATLRTIRKQGHNHKRVVIVGAGNWGREVIRRLQSQEWLGLDVIAVVDEYVQKAEGAQVEGVPYKGRIIELPNLINSELIDEVWICLPLGSRRAGGRDRIGEVMQILNNSTVTQRLLPEIEEMRILDRPVTEIMGLPVVNLNSSPMHGIPRLAKVTFDKLFALCVLAAISPLMLLIALAIKIESRGPVFFKQVRQGYDGKQFLMYKFRTMHVHKENHGVVTQASKNDARVTKVGSFLRRNSLDELPQFLNVLLGSMSVVGPRPHAIEHNEFYRTQIESYMQRHRVRPGITGWAQVNGFRGATEDIDKMRQRVNHDLYYIEHWSIWLDIKIVLRTFISGFRHENAF